MVDREDFLASLVLRLRSHQSLMLAGPRRIGKTSLAYEVLRRLNKQGCYVADVDLFSILTKLDFAVFLTDACLRNRTGLQRTINAIKDGLKSTAGSTKLLVKVSDLELGSNLYGKDEDEDRSFRSAMDLAERLAMADGKNMVVVFDEFQEISRIAGSNAYKIMRSYLQNHKRVSYLFLGSKQSLMKSIFSNTQQAFYRFATILPIPPVPEDAWVGYITRKFLERHCSADGQLVRAALGLTGGHPQDTMLLCSEAYFAMLEAGSGDLRYDLLKAAYRRAMTSLSPVFESMLDEMGMNGEPRKMLKRIATNAGIYSGEHPNRVKRAVDNLIARSMIERTGRGSYRFLEPMFRDYILSLD